MGAQVLTIAGQVIGSIIYPGIGTAIGGAIGAVAGNLLFPVELPAQTGPRLNDLKVQSSAPGSPISQVYGPGMRVTGALIWANGIEEVASTEELGGKGGPTQESTTFAYQCDFTIGLCEGPIDSIRRIWANNQCYYDVSDQTNAEALISSGNFAQYFKVYLGTETELADPTEEAVLGVGNVPAYRGTARVVFTNLPLAAFGNRIPNLEFEVVAQGPSGRGRLVLQVQDLDFIATTDFFPIITEFSSAIRVANIGADKTNDALVYDLDGIYQFTESETEREYQITNNVNPSGTGSPGVVWNFDDELYEDSIRLMYDGRTDLFSATATVYAQFMTGNQSMISGLIPTSERLGGVIMCEDEKHFLVFTFTVNTMEKWYLIRYIGYEDDPPSELIDQGTFGSDLHYLSSAYSPMKVMNGLGGPGVMERDLKHVWLHTTGELHVWEIDYATNVITEILLFTGTGFDDCAIWPNNGLLALYGNYEIPVVSSQLSIYSRLPDGLSGNFPLGEIVSAICQRAGFSIGELSTSALTEYVLGYAIGQQMSARAAIELLASFYQFNAVESNGILKFSYRNGPPIETIPYISLGAGPEGSERQSVIEHERRQETELPVRVNIRYASADAMHQIGAQTAWRTVTGSITPQTLEAAIAMTDDRAKQAADRILYEQWVGRITRKFSCLREYAHIEPTDIVLVEDINADYTLRMLEKRDSGAICEFVGIDVDAVIYDPAPYSPVASSSAPTPGGQPPTMEAVTRIILMDIPMLRDADDNPSVYAAAYSMGSGSWTGTVIKRADTAGGPFSEIASTTMQATIGRASTVLGNFVGGNVFDFSNTVDVQLFNGTLASITRSQVINNGNYALLGDELIQFQNAVLLSGSTYRLSQLLRARKGTDAALDTHVAGDRFVLLSSSNLFRIPVAVDQIGATRYYRSATFGSTETSTYDQSLLQTGAAIKPLPPGNITAVRELSTDDVVIRWHRRARIAAAWRDLVDVPLDETTEAYEIDIYDDTNATLMRTLTSTTTEQTYTSAQQITDFGYDTEDFWIRIYQMSDRVGRGFAGQYHLT